MIFLGDLTKLTTSKYKIGLIHYKPLDPANGIKKPDKTLYTVEELTQNGIFVQNIPEPVIPEGKTVAGMFINPATNDIWYEYEDSPLTMEEKVVQLEQQNAELTIILGDLILGGM